MTLQFTAVFVVFVIVAVNCCVAPSGRDALLGVTEIVMGGGGGGPPATPAQPMMPSADDVTQSNGQRIFDDSILRAADLFPTTLLKARLWPENCASITREEISDSSSQRLNLSQASLTIKKVWGRPPNSGRNKGTLKSGFEFRGTWRQNFKTGVFASGTVPNRRTASADPYSRADAFKMTSSADQRDPEERTGAMQALH